MDGNNRGLNQLYFLKFPKSQDKVMWVAGKTLSIEFLKLFTSLEIHLASQVCSSEIVGIATSASYFNPLISKCNTAQ